MGNIVRIHSKFNERPPIVRANVYMSNHTTSAPYDAVYTFKCELDIANVLSGFKLDYLNDGLFDYQRSDPSQIFAEITACPDYHEQFARKQELEYFAPVLTVIKDERLVPTTYEVYRLEINADDYKDFVGWRDESFFAARRENIANSNTARIKAAVNRVIEDVDKSAKALNRTSSAGSEASKQFVEELQATLEKYIEELS